MEANEWKRQRTVSYYLRSWTLTTPEELKAEKQEDLKDIKKNEYRSVGLSAFHSSYEPAIWYRYFKLVFIKSVVLSGGGIPL